MELEIINKINFYSLLSSIFLPHYEAPCLTFNTIRFHLFPSAIVCLLFQLPKLSTTSSSRFLSPSEAIHRTFRHFPTFHGITRPNHMTVCITMENELQQLFSRQRIFVMFWNVYRSYTKHTLCLVFSKYTDKDR